MGGRSGQSTGGGGGGGLGSGAANTNLLFSEFGSNNTGLSNKTLLKIAGIPNDVPGIAKIYFNNTNGAAIEFNGNGITMIRSINANDKTISNDFFKISNSSIFKGKGAEIFDKQVKNAQKAGFKKIKVEAAGHKGDTFYNGYYTWARLGYIPRDSQARVNIIKNITGVDYGNFQTMMRTEEGIKAWKEHGESFIGTFDLKKGSESIKTLNNYIKNKKKN